MAKKTNFGPILTRLAQIWVPQIFLWILPLLVEVKSTGSTLFQAIILCNLKEN